MVDKLTRVRIIHDSTASDPRHDMELMCEIKSTDGLHRCTLEAELIVKEFETGYRNEYRYIAHTTPELCSVPGVKWEDAEAAMDADIEMFEQWVNGDVYGYVIEEADPPEDPDDPDNEPEWEQTDGCWGFYGSDPFENGMADHVPEELHDMLRCAEVEYGY